MNAERLIEEARAWIGTPFLFGQSVKGEGADCAGLALGILRECGLLTPEAAANLHAGAPRLIPDGYLRERVLTVCRPVKADFTLVEKAGISERLALQPGDVLLFAIGGIEQHCGLYVGEARMVHALATLGRAAEQTIGDGWRERLTGVFRVRGVR